MVDEEGLPSAKHERTLSGDEWRAGTVTGFALIWNIWRAVLIGLAGPFVNFVYAIGAQTMATADRAMRAQQTRATAPSNWLATARGATAHVSAAACVIAPVEPHPLQHPYQTDGAPPLGGIGPKLVIVGHGFWLLLISDIIVFAAFFAAHAVLRDATAGGPTGT